MYNMKEVVFGTVFLILVLKDVHCMSKSNKNLYKEKVLEMFDHAYNSYMTHAYPADELMPLSCRGRVRGRELNRGDIDDALGDFSLTLVDTLDSLAVLGKAREFNRSIKKVLENVKFDANLVVSVFETNIRVLGGLLGAHFAALALKSTGEPLLQWYTDQLVWKADKLAQKLLPAFSSTTGLPYARINLLTGLVGQHQRSGWDTTCTACAGSMLLEFAALSRVTGNPEYEEKAHRAMEVIWQKRNEHHHLVGNVINVTSGEWINKESGVGAGIDSYYEYCLKSYIVLGDDAYLKRFQKHYSGIMRFIANGPYLVDCNMNRPQNNRKHYMDSLLAFWPGLQVLWGDIESAASTHDLLYFVNHKHHFLPEAFNLDMRGVVWANHPLRPEFAESTYFLYKATGDPYYLDIGKSIIESLNRYARVPCGFAAVKDVRTKSHEDRMDSFVLAETFKYLYLLFAEEEELVIPIDDYVFTTEAHLLSLSLSRVQKSKKAPPPPNVGGKSKKQIKPVMTVPTEEKQYTCPVSKRGWTEVLHFERVLKKQTSSPRFKPNVEPSIFRKDPRQSADQQKAREDEQKVLRHYFPGGLDIRNAFHQMLLHDLGITLNVNGDGTFLVSYNPSSAKNYQLADHGLVVIRSIATAQNVDPSPKRAYRTVKVINSSSPVGEMVGSPAQFGPDMGPGYVLRGTVLLGDPFNGCSSLVDSDSTTFQNKIVVIQRGGCSFMSKVRNAQLSKAKGVIVIDNASSSGQPTLAMAQDGTVDDITIHSVFLSKKSDVDVLLSLVGAEEEVLVEITVIQQQNDGSSRTKDGVAQCEGSKEQDQQP